MARTKQFDYDEALENATRVFWEKGYEATSVQDLVAATGVNRASLYETFGDKRELFRKALEHFRSTQEKNFEVLTERSRPGLDRIQAFFRNVARESLCDSRGCLVVNSTTELAGRDPKLREAAGAVRETLERFFLTCLRDAQNAGEIPAGRDERAQARFLTNAIFGLRVMAKLHPNRTAVNDIVATTLAALV